MGNRVVVTGLGVVSPNGVGKKEFYEAIKNGKSGIAIDKRLDDLNFRCQISGIPEIKDSYKDEFIDSVLSRKLIGNNLIYGILSGLEAWRDAGFSRDINNEEADWETGCVFGNSSTNPEIIVDVHEKISSGKSRTIRARTVEQSMTSCVSAYLTGVLGLGNCQVANSSACSTGTESILIGYEKIKNNEAKRMLVGSSEGDSPITWAGFDRISALNTNSNNNPTEASRPLSASANGFIPGAGAGALILEDLETAKKRKAKIYAEVLGGSANCGGQRNGGSMTKPNVLAVQKCIEKALSNSGVNGSDIDLICGHLTGTFADPLEVKSWFDALSVTKSEFPYINSLKSMIGHCLGASGSIECVSAILQLENDFVHPSLNCIDLHPDVAIYVDKNKIPNEGINNAHITHIAKASFGFGDVNSCLILKKWKKDD